MDEEKPFNPYDASRPTSELVNIKPSVPDFVTKTKEYLKQHPEAIREVAGDEIQKVEEWLDTLPMGIGELGKAKINEFLGGEGTHTDSQEEGKDAPGATFISPDRQGQGEEQQTEPEENMTTQDAKDLLDFMAELSEQGFSLPEISDAVWRDYRIEYHPLKIKRMLKSYYARPEPEPEEETENRGVSQGSLKMYQKLLEKNIELQKKVAELTPKIPPEIVKSERKGIIRRFLGWLW